MIGLGLGLGIPQPLTMSWVVRITPPAMHGAALQVPDERPKPPGPDHSAVSIGALAAPLGAEGVSVNAALLGLALLTIPRQLDDSRQQLGSPKSWRPNRG